MEIKTYKENIKNNKVFQNYLCPSVRPGWSGGVRPSRPNLRKN